jgi:hypothetical protein
MEREAIAKLDAAITPTRSLDFYTLTATIPLFVITGVLLFMHVSRKTLTLLATIGVITGVIGLGRLLFDMTMDIAGFPDYKLPIWAVVYLVVYLISAFTFLFFAMHLGAPGRYFGGFHVENPKIAFLDSIYLSLTDYIGMSPDPTITMNSRLPRFLTVGQGVLSMFINVVIITKFVSSF